MRNARPAPLCLLLGLLTLATAAHAQAPLPTGRLALVAFDSAPFPYRGEVPDKNIPFLDVINGDRRGHTAPRGGVYWEDITYSDRRALLSIPKGFDARRPALIVVFLHGNLALLERDVRDRQQVPRQVAESGRNAVLVAPQLARDALDSSSGRFWEPGVFASFLDEAADRLARLHGDPRTREMFARAPVVLVAYSGGYNPAAFALAVGGANGRIAGVILLDGLFAELDKFADWLGQRPNAFFVSAYTKAARAENAALQKMLTERGIAFATTLPARLSPGSTAFLATGPEVVHNDFVTRAWVNDPVKFLLAKVPGFSRAAPVGTAKGKK